MVGFRLVSGRLTAQDGWVKPAFVHRSIVTTQSAGVGTFLPFIRNAELPMRWEEQDALHLTA